MDTYFNDPTTEYQLAHKKNARKVAVLLTSVVAFLLLLVTVAPSNSLASPTYITINKGETLKELAVSLHDADIIRSKFFFTSIVVLLGKERTIIPGDYYFDSSGWALEVAERVSSGDFGIEQIKVTFPEGVTRLEMARILKDRYPQFDMKRFMDATVELEGYLFPSTYFFSPIATEEDIIERMHQEFEHQTLSLRETATESPNTWAEYVTMASIVEAEAGESDDRSIIAGILWKRIEEGMHLQVDAPFAYILNKTSAELTIKDLETDTPYNTYTNSGLPPTPIGNPGLLSLEAVLSPKVSPYYFYLHDKAGIIHYAKTFAEHKANIDKYLR